MDNFIQTLQRRGDIISGSATEIWNLKESLEKEGMTAVKDRVCILEVHPAGVCIILYTKL